MQIANDTVVTLKYTLTDNSGKVIDQSQDGSFVYLHGASNIIPGLENALAGKAAGDAVVVAVAPADGYGEHDPERMQAVPRNMFPEDTQIETGMQFHAEGPDQHQIVVTVTKVEDDTVTVDGNHPLAGVELNFDVEIVDVRDASDEEKNHGHAHGPDGHHHN